MGTAKHTPAPSAFSAVKRPTKTCQAWEAEGRIFAHGPAGDFELVHLDPALKVRRHV